MKLQVIRGGRSDEAAPVPANGTASAGIADVLAEARRRSAALGLEEARVRAFLTGRVVSPNLAYAQLQITYTAEALARLHPIPADFRDDRYWPSTVA